MRSGSSESGDRTRSAYRSPPAGRSSASTGAGLRTGGSCGARAQPRGGLLALQPAQAGFKPLEILVGHDLVTARGGWRPTVRIGSGLQRGGRFRIDGVFPGGLARRAQRMVAVVALAERRALAAPVGCVVGAQIGSIEVDGMPLRGKMLALFVRRTRRPRRLCLEPGGKIRFTGEW